MGGSLRKGSEARQHPTENKTASPPIISGAQANGCAGSCIDENGNKTSKNYFSTKKSSNGSLADLPLADKTVTVEGSRRLLKNASFKAMVELDQTAELPGLKELSNFTFPFENAVFEGGGVKGIAYIGAVQCLNDVGIKMRRFAGSSIGATVAGFLAVGYSAEEMVALYVQDLSIFIRDSKCELLCFLPRLISKFGLNPGKAFVDWYGRCLAVKTQDPDITFSQVYQRFGTELCVVVLNMNTGREEYFHPKTTPDMSVRIAIRMSISVPGVLEPIPMHHAGGSSDLYIDGGVICNYPIYVFDGWWLSMDPQDHIYRKLCNGSHENISFLCDVKSKFSQRDPKTLGFKQTINDNFFNESIIQSSISEDFEIVKKQSVAFSRPNTKLVRKRIKHLMSLEKAAQVHSATLGALLELFKALKKCCNPDGYVLKDKLQETLASKQNGFTESHITTLFGKGITAEQIVKNIPSHNNLITAFDLDQHLRRLGLDIHRVLESSVALRGSSLTNAKSFWSRLQRNITSAARRSYVKPEDAERTVNIHTDYIQFLDFEMCSQDKEFLIQQGYKYTLSFLRNYMQKQLSTEESHNAVSPAKEHSSAGISAATSCDSTDSSPMFYIDEEDEYNTWLNSLKTDNV